MCSSKIQTSDGQEFLIADGTWQNDKTYAGNLIFNKIISYLFTSVGQLHW
jgi:hypothetical protein